MLQGTRAVATVAWCRRRCWRFRLREAVEASLAMLEVEASVATVVEVAVVVVAAAEPPSRA